MLNLVASKITARLYKVKHLGRDVAARQVLFPKEQGL
jgi:hypothetical protein